jgi:quinolinate synthase
VINLKNNGLYLDNYKLSEEIKKLKRSKNAIFLIHNYQLEEVKQLGDYVGDSLGLAIQARNVDSYE